ncbi:MAG: MltA domain-containing protein [Phenylobacterium sp.]|uniref:MltA domain-containing protein n=1 Tax=Phenylobacterium sp. TaxID=1871053 RepID=UPI002733A776|nr:MltA domain-containing protein [Phenylobacterium sp.]MDP3175496.1 MltA domain-containing protein [Phenylobacterium sp.]
MAALIVAACATQQPGPRPSSPSRPQPTQPAPAPRLDLSHLPGWRSEDHAAAFAAFQATCGAAADSAMAEVCRRARARTALDDRQARAFFEENFRAEASAGEGVLTGYFAPEYPARWRPDAEFSAPVRPKPSDLVVSTPSPGRPAVSRKIGSRLEPYPDRAAIEAAPVGRALAWMRPEELFFLQIQGSGVLTMEDGRRMKAGVAATNGLPFVGIANPMRERGLLAGNNTSGDAIRNWLAAHKGPEADAVMRLNPRYVFFTLGPDDGLPPMGSARVPLPAGYSIAVDASQHRMGELFWLDAEAPTLAGAFPAYRRLAMALDTGGAIKGAVRADLYLGQGARAGAEAGRVRHTLRMYKLAPRVGPQPR